MNTPGPWRVMTVTATDLPAVAQVDGPVIAEISKWGSVGTVDLATSWDNARLIAASPELLEALEMAKGAVEWMAGATHSDPEDHELLELVNKAIAKAYDALP